MLDGPYLAGCLLMVAAGLAKVRRPHDTARALAELITRPPLQLAFGTATIAVRVLAALELAVGLLGMWAPSSVSAGMVAGSYVGFSAFVLVALVRGGSLATCGCFAKVDTPPTVTHVVLTLVIAASAATVAATAGPGWHVLWSFVGHQPLHGAPMLLSAVAVAVVAWLAMTLLPTLRAAR